jgi:predicted neutral ceramidase superfamily lipid hydrolase
MYTFALGLFTLKVDPFALIIKKYFNEHKGYLKIPSVYVWNLSKHMRSKNTSCEVTSIYNSFMFAISFNFVLLIPILQVHNYRNKSKKKYKLWKLSYFQAIITYIVWNALLKLMIVDFIITIIDWWLLYIFDLFIFIHWWLCLCNYALVRLVWK